MIKIDVETTKPDNVKFIVETEEEQIFIHSFFPQIFDKFIQERSPYESTQEYLDDVYRLYRDGDEIDLHYKCNKITSMTKGSVWKDWVVKALEEMVNNEFKIYKEKK